ncbi:hypothetical protein [Halostagnicola bangensis]
MSSNTLDSFGRAILETLEDEQLTADTLEAAFETSRETLEERLSQLVDNALVRQGDGGRYELTDNGRRVLRATSVGKRDDRIDIPAAVEASLEGFSLPPDREDAVRKAFSFLQYWGDATTVELIDGCYSESPAGYDTAKRWWGDCVEKRLRGLSLVEPPRSESIDSPDLDEMLWRYENVPVVETPDDVDGRDVPDPQPGPMSFGSVRHGIEKIEMSDVERTAARVAFAVLFDRETVTAAELVERVYGDYPAGYDSSDDWTVFLSDVFDALPGIERDSETMDEVVWSYWPSHGLETDRD